VVGTRNTARGALRRGVFHIAYSFFRGGWLLRVADLDVDNDSFKLALLLLQHH
jgi:hypothetical protein